MGLHDLAPELLSLILQAVDRPRDLHSLIRASGPCFRVYALSPVLTLSSVLRNAILPDALRHALALAHIPAAPSDSGLQPLEAFLDGYFQAGSFWFPAAKATIVVLCRLYSRISYFIDDYSARAMRALDPELDAEQAATLSLSPTERARFQRAFFRYELYSRVFPVDQDARYRSLVPASVQFTRFLARIEPWEAEEMSCVHHYFTSLIGGFVDNLEDEVVETVLAAPGVRCPPGLARSSQNRVPTAGGPTGDSLLRPSKPIRTEGDNGQSLSDDSDMVLFDHLDLRDLDLFSRDGRFRSPSTISYLASLGSAFIYQLALAEKNQRKDMIRENTPVWRDFLPEALECTPGTGPMTAAPAEVDDQPSHPNLAYYLVKRSEQDVYFHIRRGGTANSPLRERAFVFWDAKRVLRPAVSASLQEARCMDPEKLDLLFNRYRGQSAEDRLKGVRIPRAQMGRIIEEFGSVFDSWPLSWAAEKGREVVVQRLLGKGAFTKPRSNTGWTPLS